MRWSGILVCVGLMALSLQAQSSVINGPILGFASDESGTTISPIIGIPGASALAQRLQLDTPIRGVVISPKQDYAIANRTRDAQPVVIDLSGDAPVIRDIAGVHAGGDVLAISPLGSAAAVYDHESGMVQVIGHLPQAPELIRGFDASTIPGTVSSIAVSDDGRTVLVRFAGPGSAALWMMNSSGALWLIPADRPSAAAFFPNSSDAIVADDGAQTAFVLLDIGGRAARVPLISSEDGISTFSWIATSDDGRQVFLGDAKSGNISVVDMETRRATPVSCECRLTGLYPLKGNSVFRLSETSSEPIMVLDVSTTQTRIVVIPPRTPVEAETR